MNCDAALPGKTALSSVLIYSLLFTHASVANSQVQPAAPGLSIQVLEGQGAINNVSRGTAFEPVVAVQNERGMPLAGATVTFNLPNTGPGGTFPDGAKTLVTRTDENGRAVARGLRPNSLSGQFDIRVSAVKDGKSATAIVTQTNAAPARVESGGSRKWLIVLGIVGGAAAAGVAAASGGKGSSPAPAATVSTVAGAPPGTVTPGVPGFGPPR